MLVYNWIDRIGENENFYVDIFSCSHLTFHSAHCSSRCEYTQSQRDECLSFYFFHRIIYKQFRFYHLKMFSFTFAVFLPRDEYNGIITHLCRLFPFLYRHFIIYLCEWREHENEYWEQISLKIPSFVPLAFHGGIYCLASVGNSIFRLEIIQNSFQFLFHFCPNTFFLVFVFILLCFLSPPICRTICEPVVDSINLIIFQTKQTENRFDCVKWMHRFEQFMRMFVSFICDGNQCFIPIELIMLSMR